MTHETAHKILSAHQAWRRGLVDAMEHTAAEVNQALEVAISALQLQSKAPDWSQAPEGFDWYAVDGDGDAFWFQNRPYDANGVWLPTMGKALSAKPLFAETENYQALYKRPGL